MNGGSPFKKPRLPAPGAGTRLRINHIPSDDEDDDDEILGNYDTPKTRAKNNKSFLDLTPKDYEDEEEEEEDPYDEFSELSFSKLEMSFASQTQLSQVRFQEGQFTYHPDFIDKDSDCDYGAVQFGDISRVPQKYHLPYPLSLTRDKSFFHAIRENFQQGQYQMLGKNLNESYHHFVQSSTSSVLFLRMYLRVYPKLTIERFGGGNTGRHEFKKVKLGYLGFWRHFLNNIALVNWKRSEIMELFHSDEPLPHNYFFSIVSHLMRQCVKYKQFNLDPIHSTINPNILFVFDFFQLLVQFLVDDFDQFMTISDNYSADIYSMLSDSKPLIVRMIWQNNKKPDYVSSVFKFFISHLVKSFKLDIVQVFTSLMELFTRLSESVRICAGNSRPFLQINSSRVAMAEELYNAMQRDVFKDTTEDWTQLRTFLALTSSFPWLNLQMCVVILKRFINLSQHFHKGKYRLSLRMLLHTYLAGNVDAFKFEDAERVARLEIREKSMVYDESTEQVDEFLMDKQLETSGELEAESSNAHRTRSKRQPFANAERDKDCEYLNPNINVNNLQVLYRKYSSTGEKTSFGGNSLHIACRRGDAGWISTLWDLIDPNMADSQGYTPLNDAARFGHSNCVNALIEASKESGMQLDFETPCQVDGTTPLHNAILKENEESIRLILEFGGRHLLKIRMHSGEAAEDLLPESLKTLPASVEYKNTINVLPTLSDVTEAEVYARTLAYLLEAYLNTTRLSKFVCIYQQFMADSRDIQQEPTDADIRLKFYHHFTNIWGRPATEEDIDHLMDDIEMLPKIRLFIAEFMHHSLAHFSDSSTNWFTLLFCNVDHLLDILNNPPSDVAEDILMKAIAITTD